MYKWYYCYDGDEEGGWHGAYQTRAAALAQAVESAPDYCKTIMLVEATNAKLSVDGVFDAETILGDLMDINDDVSDDEGGIGLESVTTVEAMELEIELNATLEAWLTKYEWLYSPYAFGDRRNEETIDAWPLMRPQ